MFSFNSKQWRAVAMAALIVTGTLALVSMPLPNGENEGIVRAEQLIDTNETHFSEGFESGSLSGYQKILNNGEEASITSDATEGEYALNMFAENVDDSNRAELSKSVSYSVPDDDSKALYFSVDLKPKVDNNIQLDGEYTTDGRYNIHFDYRDDLNFIEFMGVYFGTNLEKGEYHTIEGVRYLDQEVEGESYDLYRVKLYVNGKEITDYPYASQTEYEEGLTKGDMLLGSDDIGNTFQNFNIKTRSGSSGNTDINVDDISLGTVDKEIAENIEPTGDGDITGKVVDQDGLAQAGTSVEAYGVQTANLPNGVTAQDILEDASNAEPPGFDANLDFDPFTSDVSGTYPLIHDREDWGLTGWTEGVNVETPKLRHRANEPFVVSAWDPSAGGVGDSVNSIYNTWPGRPEGGETVTITKIDAAGNAVGSTQTYETSEDDTYFAPGPTQPGKAEVNGLAEGFYRISVEGSSAGYPIAITPDGTLDSLLELIQNDIEDGLDRLPSNVKEVQELTDDGVIKRYTTTTDSEGEFAINVDEGVNRVAIQAAKHRFTTDLDSETDIVTQVKNQIDHEQDFDTRVAFSRKPQQTSVPGRVTVEVYRLNENMLKTCDPSILGEEICAVADEATIPETPEEVVDEVEDALSQLEQYLIDLINDLDDLDQSKIDAYLENSQFSSLPDNDDVRDLSRQEVREEIRYATEAIAGVSTDPIDTEQLVETMLDLIETVENNNVVSEYLSNSQFDAIPTRSQLAELSRSELNSEVNAANLALGQAALPDPPQEPSLDPIRDRLENVLRTVGGSEDIRDAYLSESRYDEPPTREQIDGMEPEVLYDELNAANRALNAADRISAPEPDDPDISNGLLDLDIPIPSGVDPQDISAEIEWGDGSVDVIDDEYLSVDSSLVGTQTVQIREYPLEENADGRALGDVVVRTANDEGRNEQRVSVTNPAFGGDIPEIDLVDVSTIQPGPEQWVSVQLRPGDDTYGELDSVDVYDPDGNLLEVRRTGEQARFLTQGSGNYRIRMNYESRAGDQFQKQIRLRAGDQSPSLPPTIRMTRDTSGPFAIAADGFRSVDLDQTNNGNDLELSATIPGDAQAPDEIHIHPNEVQSGDETALALSVLRGTSETQIREHMGVTVHDTRFDTEEAIVYRNDNQPITIEGETRYGDVTERDDGDRHLINSYTDADGVVSISRTNDPGIVESIIHRVRVSSPVDFDSLLSTSLGGTIQAAGGATMEAHP